MSLSNDFSMAEGEGSPEPASRPASPPAVMVVEHRPRGIAARLMPPALILLTAITIASYQRKTPVWPVIPKSVAVAPVSATQAEPASAAKISLNAKAKSEQAQSRPTSPFDLTSASGLKPVEQPPAPGLNTEPSAVASASPFRGHAFNPFSVNPNAANVETSSPEDVLREIEREAEAKDAALALNLTPLPEVNNPDPSRDEILKDIQRESEQKDAERQDLESLKQNAQKVLLNEALSKVDTERLPYRDALKELLGRLGDKAGKDIEALGERYDKEPMPQVKAAYARSLKLALSRQSRAAKVATMRAIGVPEPLILDQICHDFDKYMNTRGGPRTEDEVRVRAARALLAIPLNTTAARPSSGPPGASPAAASRLPDPNAAARPVAGFGTRP